MMFVVVGRRVCQGGEIMQPRECFSSVPLLSFGPHRPSIFRRGGGGCCPSLRRYDAARQHRNVTSITLLVGPVVTARSGASGWLELRRVWRWGVGRVFVHCCAAVAAAAAAATTTLMSGGRTR